MRYIDLKCSPEEASSAPFIDEQLRKELRLPPGGFQWRIEKRSIDARSRSPVAQLRIGIVGAGEPFPEMIVRKFGDGLFRSKALVVGFGPAGIFAALRCLELGIQPIVLERGKDVRSRRHDLVSITRDGVVDEQSNYCYGEGGAGTYSDGKLYTRSTKKGSVLRILETFVQFGANENILTESHPHLGTNKLPQIITSMREAILAHGGEVHFETAVTGFEVAGGAVLAAMDQRGKRHAADHVILATGHSARDMFELLIASKIKVEPKPFAVGLRVEHPQAFVDQCQYRTPERGDYLPPAAYSVVTQVGGRGVYSFCMCPGGVVAPCATEKDGVVTNGWSPSKRNNPWANAGIVVEVKLEDLEKAYGKDPLAGVKLQREIERRAFALGGSNQFAPAQRACDFLANRLSADLPTSSYRPGVTSANLQELFPEYIAKSLVKAIRFFDSRMPGFAGNAALLIAPETRTSSPVRIPRDGETLCHPKIFNLYPCGEGAGYAGGIVSAAIDGERVAEAANARVRR